LSNGIIGKGRVGLSIRRVTQLCHWDSYRPRTSAGYGSCAGRTWGRFREHVVASGAGTGGSANQTCGSLSCSRQAWPAKEAGKQVSRAQALSRTLTVWISGGFLGVKHSVYRLWLVEQALALFADLGKRSFALLRGAFGSSLIYRHLPAFIARALDSCWIRSGAVMKLIGYLRVSTDRQLEGFGLDVQRDRGGAMGNRERS
jgi:hypothetical protein